MALQSGSCFRSISWLQRGGQWGAGLPHILPPRCLVCLTFLPALVWKGVKLELGTWLRGGGVAVAAKWAAVSHSHASRARSLTHDSEDRHLHGAYRHLFLETTMHQSPLTTQKQLQSGLTKSMTYSIPLLCPPRSFLI